MPVRTYKAPRRRSVPLGRTKPTKRIKGLATLKKQLWELCKALVRKKYQNPNGTWNCYTCDRLIDEPAKAQTGHFIASGTCGAFLRYDLRNLRIQDYYCNINLGGNGSEYYRRMVQEMGQEHVDQIFRDKQKIVKADSNWISSKIEEYTGILNQELD